MAVSGGVDSMVLLHLLTKQPGMALTVAHYDHGIRADSMEDRKLVQQVAHHYGLPFVYDVGRLGAGASEAVARKARYHFLHTVREASLASAIITAHHQDDLLETAIINVLRGTGRRGLSSIQNHDRLLRPLLLFSKEQITTYAEQHQLEWREDQTNKDEHFLRNYIRQRILPRFSTAQRQQLLVHLNTAQTLNHDIEQLLANQLHIQPAINKLDRKWFIGLPHQVAREVVASWLRYAGVDYDKKTIEKLVVAGKTLEPGKKVDVQAGVVVQVSKDYLALSHRDR